VEVAGRKVTVVSWHARVLKMYFLIFSQRNPLLFWAVTSQPMINTSSQVLEIRRRQCMRLSTDLILDYAACPKKMKLTQKQKEYQGGRLLQSTRS